MSDNSRSVEHFEPGGIKSSEVTSIFEDSPKSGLIEVTDRLGEKVSRRFHDFEDWIGQHKKASLSMAMACLAVGSIYVETTNKAPNNNPFLAAPAVITPTKASTIEMTPTKELVVKAPATPTEQPATATPKKEATPTTKSATPTEKPTTAPFKKDSPTPAQKEATPTTAPVKPNPTEIPQRRGEAIRIPAKETITPDNFFKYFEPTSDEKELVQLLDEQDKFLYLELEKPIVESRKDMLTFSGSVTLRAPFDAKIMGEAEYHKLLADYGTGRISAEKPIRYIAYKAPGQGNLAPVDQLEFVIGIMNSKGRLELGISAPINAEKAMTYYEKVGDGGKKLDRLIKFGEYGGGQGVNSVFPPNTIVSGITWVARENFGTRNPGVTFIDDLTYYVQKNGKAVVPMPPSVK